MITPYNAAASHSTVFRNIATAMLPSSTHWDNYKTYPKKHKATLYQMHLKQVQQYNLIFGLFLKIFLESEVKKYTFLVSW